MGFGISRGRELNISEIGRTADDLPPLPDDLLARPEGAWFDPRRWFDDPDAAFELEIGSGKGTFLVQQAERQPETNFLGIEWAREFFSYAADRVRRHGLRNVRMLHFDAGELVRFRMPSGIVDVLHLYFPDPWPKPRHHKRRMVSDAFLADAHRILRPSGELRVVTDHADYWAWMEEHFARWTAPDHAQSFERLPFEPPVSAGAGEVVGTNFERKYRREGRPFHAAILRRREAGDAP